MFKGKGGFTLVELIMVIVVLAILAVVAIPKYYSLQAKAQSSAEAGIVGGVRSGIATFYGNACVGGTCAYPAALDASAAGACTSANACFGNVLSQPVTSQWTVVTGGSKYTGPTGTSYTYTPATGTFQ